MPQFSYTAKDIHGIKIEGIVEAPTESLARNALRQKGVQLLSIRHVRGPAWWQKSITLFERITGRDIAIFSRQLSVMVSANLPIVQALTILSRQTNTPALTRVLQDVSEEVDGGAKLSQALGRHDKVFSSFYINLVRSGETSGQLDDVLLYLADQQEKDYDLQSKVKGAMIYPAFILFGLLTMGSVMMIFVVPKLTSVLREAGVDLPWTTRLLIGVSDWLSAFWWIVFILLVGIAVTLRYLVQTERGRIVWDTVKLHTPIFGRLFRKIYLVRFARGLMTLLHGGVPLAVALDISGDLVGNAVMRNLILSARDNVRDGHPLAEIFFEHPVTQGMTAQMLQTGEQTGKLTDILGKLAHFYDREIDNDVRSLVSLIEPMIMIVMGVAVGLVVVAIILPMYNLAGSI